MCEVRFCNVMDSNKRQLFFGHAICEDHGGTHANVVLEDIVSSSFTADRNFEARATPLEASGRAMGIAGNFVARKARG